MTGRIMNILFPDFVVLKVDDLKSLEGLTNTDLDISITKHRIHRSRNANAYFHLLVGKIASNRGLPNHYVKNMMISHYGQPYDINPVWMTLSPEEVWNIDEYHFAPIDHDDSGNILYALMRGSHTYDTKEMTTLIHGTVEEAKQLGIETLTPFELQRMINAWNQLSKTKKSASSAETPSDWSDIM